MKLTEITHYHAGPRVSHDTDDILKISNVKVTDNIFRKCAFLADRRFVVEDNL